jgi:hypothetical protein
VAEGDKRKLARICAVDSPAAVAIRLYGAAGPMWAIRAAPPFMPDALTTYTEPDPRSQSQATYGAVTAGTQQWRFSLRWRFGAGSQLVEEISGGPFDLFLRQVTPRPQVPATGLDEVTQVLVDTVSDLRTLLRAIASWQRVADQQAMTERYGATVVAAALDRSASHWMHHGTSGTYESFASMYSVDPARLRTAGGALQRTLHLSYEQPW